eukprot:Nitzschia sp. Nitz4//scaffold176_size46146//38507//44104//NITZ4_007197-RA/size46146-processed-gene-0.28-mRNA-1//1//CDS//3329539030//9219//frame0
MTQGTAGSGGHSPRRRSNSKSGASGSQDVVKGEGTGRGSSNSPTATRSSRSGSFANSSASTPAAGGEQATPTPAEASPPVSTRAKRRSRGLPTTKANPTQGSTGETTAVKSENTDPEAATTSGQAAPVAATTAVVSSASEPSTPVAAPKATMRSPRASRSSTAAAKSTLNIGTIPAKIDNNKDMQVSVMVGGEAFLPVESIPSVEIASSSKTSTSPTTEPSSEGTPGVSTRKRSTRGATNTPSKAGQADSNAASPASGESVPDEPSSSIANPPSTSGSGETTPKESTDVQSHPSLPLGHDGNMFYCFVCGGVGDVVCCDGCPRVYHRDCVPQSSLSKHSLLKDEDPWYCPDCYKTHHGESSSANQEPRTSGRRGRARSSSGSKEPGSTGAEDKEHEASPMEVDTNDSNVGVSKTCFECNEVGDNLQQCQGCREWIHYPTCPWDQDANKDKSADSGKQTTKGHGHEAGSDSDREIKVLDGGSRVLCSICRVEEGSSEKKNGNNPRAKNITGDSDTDNTSNENIDVDAAKDDGDNDGMEVDEQSQDGDEDAQSPSPSLPDNTSSNNTNDTPVLRRRRRGSSVGNAGKNNENDGKGDDEDNSSQGSTPPSRSRRGSPKSTTPKDSPSIKVKRSARNSLPSSKVKSNLEESSFSSGSAKKKKEGKKRKSSTSDRTGDDNSNFQNENEEESHPLYHTFSHAGQESRTVQATPAFFYFVNENRYKIERNLARKHRIFNRLPKGYERNELVAQEAAVWWSKLKPSEVRRFMSMSMTEFEQRIIEWKEEKNIRDMFLEDSGPSKDEEGHTSIEDEQVTSDNHKRLYLGTTVGSKPFKPESDMSHNTVLLELLRDMRFHPMPLFLANRGDTEYGQLDFDRITIPYFDVHGPFSTSVGDECLGCSRGWNHMCNILKRRVPAVEHRAKLQPPLSSIMATRVGLGLRPKGFSDENENNPESDSKDVPLFSVREIPDVTTSKHLPQTQWDSLSTPTDRADDVVQFIEETIAMKVPEPVRPDSHNRLPDGPKRSSMGMGSLSMLSGRKRHYDTMNGQEAQALLNKCGRCRTVIQTDMGCIQCRRAQLVIKLSRRIGSEEKRQKSEKGENGSKLAKVQTVMCGRVNMKDGSGEIQSESDQMVASGILRQRWTPFSVLPPHTMESPTPRPTHNKPMKDSSNDDDSSDDEEDDAGDSVEGEDIVNGAPKGSTRRASNPSFADSDDSSQGSHPRADSTDLDEQSIGADSSDHPSKRYKSARIAEAMASHADPEEEEDRKNWARRFKEEADQLQKTCLRTACCGVLLALMRRDPLLLFASPVNAEGYSTVIKNPMDFGKIRTNVQEGSYATLGSFVADCKLLCTNALTYNPPGSIYWKTAKELLDVLNVMQKRASRWISAIKDTHAGSWRRRGSGTTSKRTPPNASRRRGRKNSRDSSDADSKLEFEVDDPFGDLEEKWPEAVEMLMESDWLTRSLAADFMRTRENETAYYGALAIRRTAAACETALATYPDTSGVFNTVSRRSHLDDEALRSIIDDRVAEITDPVELKDIPTWREEAVIRVLRRGQNRRMDGRSGSSNGCARCNGYLLDAELKRALSAQPAFFGKSRRKNNEVPRIAAARVGLSTGMASESTQTRIKGVVKEWSKAKDLKERAKAANEVAVSVRGSGIHGWGLFADQSFKKGDVVAEYIGEYVSLAVTEAREKMYQEERIQDYQFRVDDHVVIDATMRGGHGRYINHNCSPNCVAKVIDGSEPNGEHLKRVIILAVRDIKPREELTYDYQFPLELNLDARIPCNCQSDQCRGFMNWDLPEKGSNNHMIRAQKRGANMRDRIRRLGRPLKGDRDEASATTTTNATKDETKESKGADSGPEKKQDDTATKKDDKS